MELGILTLGDLQRDLSTERAHRPVDRMADILGYAALADQLGLDVFAVGEHHSPEFFTSSPAVVLAAAAARTTAIKLASATTLLGIADPVRVYEDFATVDLVSRGRAEIIAGRSAFVEPFKLFGYDTVDYDALFAEKLGLLLDIRSSEKVTWQGRFRPSLDGAFVTPRAVQDPLPVWVGVGGSTESVERAGQARAADDPRLHRRHARARQAARRPLPGSRRARRARGLAQARALHPLPRRRGLRVRPRHLPATTTSTCGPRRQAAGASPSAGPRSRPAPDRTAR